MAVEPETKATWLWNSSMIVNNGAGTLAFLEAKHINKLYLQIDRTISNDSYRSFIEQATAKGIQVLALDGAPDWAAPKGNRSLDQFLSWMKTYQSSASPNQKFSGVHLDVEPYLYSGWSTNQATTIKRYQDLLTRAQIGTSALNLPLEADLPFWFDGTTYKNTYGKGFLAEWVIAHTNSVTIMAYRDSAPSIIDLVKNEMKLAEKYNKQIVVGVETAQTSEGLGLSFYEEGEAYMNQELAKVQDYYADSSGFGGLAIHHVGSWERMQP